MKKEHKISDRLSELTTIIKDSTKVQELFETADELWNLYFLSKELKEGERKEVMELHNLAAKAANKHAGSERLIMITKSTRWEPRLDDKDKPVKRHTPYEGNEEVKEDKPKKSAERKTKEGGKGIIDQILDLHKEGKTNKEIVEAGFNKSTVNRQVSEYKKRTTNGKE